MSDIESPIHAYVGALVDIGGQLVSTIDHMRRHGNPPAGSDDIPAVLTTLLEGILADELEHPPDDLYACAAVINATSAAIQENLLLVGPGELGPPPVPPRSGRSRRRGR